MPNTPILFDTLIRFESKPSYEHFDHRAENIRSISVHLQKTFILADHFKKQLFVFNNSPQLSNIINSTDTIKSISEQKFIEKIPQKHRCNFTHIFLIINDYILSHKNNDSDVFYFSFRTPLIDNNNIQSMVEFKVLPYIYTDDSPNKLPWITYIQCTRTTELTPGRLTLHNVKERSETLYLLNNESTHLPDFITLKQIDLAIFELACQGFSESEIAENLNISTGTLKRIKSSIMMYLNTQSTAQTITLLYQQGLI